MKESKTLHQASTFTFKSVNRHTGKINKEFIESDDWQFIFDLCDSILACNEDIDDLYDDDTINNATAEQIIDYCDCFPDEIITLSFN